MTIDERIVGYCHKCYCSVVWIQELRKFRCFCAPAGYRWHGDKWALLPESIIGEDDANGAKRAGATGLPSQSPAW
jgi:hypothetical protein